MWDEMMEELPVDLLEGPRPVRAKAPRIEDEEEATGWTVPLDGEPTRLDLAAGFRRPVDLTIRTPRGCAKRR